MRQLIYISFANSEFDEVRDIPKILEASQKNTPPLDITGLLLYRGGLFLQLIEGTEKNIQILYDKILKDPRHRNAKILVRGEGKERLFKTWTMAYRSLKETDLSKIKQILPWKDLIYKAEHNEQIDNEAILKIMKTFSLELKREDGT